MALRGNLRDFSLPDVFQLVAFSQKTGVLRIDGPDAEGTVWFRDGEIFFAQSNWKHEPLGQRLVAGGKITAAALGRALEIQAAEQQQARRLGQILIDENYISEHILEAFVQEQIQDTIFDLMRWDEGEFDFEPIALPSSEDIGLSVSIENVIMEGSRRLDEWNRIKKKIPSMEIVFKMATAPGEGTFEISLKPIEWHLLLKVDGTRTIPQLAHDTGRTDFEVARILYGLFSAGLLEVAPEEEVERLRADRVRYEQRLMATRGALVEPETPVAEEPAGLPPVASVVPPQVVPTESEVELPAETPERVVEVPAFLSGDRAAASSEDVALFEQMVSAVLDSSVPEAQAPTEIEAEPEAVQEVSAGPEPTIEVQEVPVAPIAEVAAKEIAEVLAAPEPAGDFETDLRALGLGETPVELVEPMGAAEDEGLTVVAEPEIPEEVAESEVPTEVAEPRGVLADLLSSLEEDEVPPVQADVLVESSEETQEETDAVGLIATETISGERPTEGVISTDAFLSDFDVSSASVGLSSGIGDELTALTGVGGVTSRPSATVNRIPEPGESGMRLQRDAMVDQDLVKRIIEGIERL